MCPDFWHEMWHEIHWWKLQWGPEFNVTTVGLCLKALIMAKAAEDLRNEAKAKAEEKERYINERVPPCDTQGQDKGRLHKSMQHEMSQLKISRVLGWCSFLFSLSYKIRNIYYQLCDTQGKDKGRLQTAWCSMQ